MGFVSKQQWGMLEEWTPRLFVIGFVLELVFAVNHGAAYLLESISFFDWIYPSVLLGRFAVLLGLAGLSVGLIERDPRVGKLSRILLGIAMLFYVGMVALAILDIVGVSTSFIAVFGLGTVVTTVLCFVLFAVAGFRTDAYPTVVGGLLLVATVAILFVMLTSSMFSTNLRGAVGEGLNAIAFLGIWYVLSTRGKATMRTEPVRETAAE